MGSPKSWRAYHRSQVQRKYLALFSGAVSLLALALLWWLSYTERRAVPTTTLEWVLILVATVSFLVAVYLFWTLAGTGLEELELFLNELRRVMGGELHLKISPISRPVRAFAARSGPATSVSWWENVDHTYTGILTARETEVIATLHEPRWGRRWLELKVRRPRDNFPFMWLWYRPPFKFGFRVNKHLYVDSRESMYRIRPYAQSFERWALQYGLKNVRFEDGYLEVRFSRLRAAPEDVVRVVNEIEALA